MARLVAYGCSFTYGTGLSDSYYSYEPDWYGPLQPSMNLAWCAQAAQHLGISVVNRGIPGASNLEILVRALRSAHEPGDILVFLWTHHHRDLTFTQQPIPHAGDGKQWWQLGPWSRGTDALKLVRNDADFDYVQRTFLYQHHAEQAFRNHLIIHGTVEPIPVQRPPYLPIQHTALNGFASLDLGSDNRHPGPASHAAVGQVLADYVNQHR